MKITNTIPNPTNILRFWKWGLLAFAVVAFTLTLAQSSTPRTEAGNPLSMSLEVKGAGSDCRSDTQIPGANCQIDKGSKFTVSIDLKSIPFPYLFFQTLVTWSGQLTYQKTASASSEIKWPDSVLPLRTQEPKGPGSVTHSSDVFFNPASTFVGNIVNLEFFCDPALSGKGVINLVPYDPVLQPFGSLLFDAVSGNTVPAPPAQLSIDCVVPETMSLVVKGAGADCRSDTQVLNCQIDKGSKFIVSIDLKSIPFPYTDFQTLVTWSGQLTYQKAASVSSEIKWPDCVIPARAQEPKGPGSVVVGCTVFFNPPSTFVGNIVNLEFFCDPALSGKGVINLVPYDPLLQTSGSALIDSGTFFPVPPAQLSITCVQVPNVNVTFQAKPLLDSALLLGLCVEIRDGFDQALKGLACDGLGAGVLVPGSVPQKFTTQADEDGATNGAIQLILKANNPFLIQKGQYLIFAQTVKDAFLGFELDANQVPGNGEAKRPCDVLVGKCSITFSYRAQKLPDPGDTDGDGCSDVRENGTDPQQGGLRNYLNPWDFYDVWGQTGPAGAWEQDEIVDLFNDIVGVISRFGKTRVGFPTPPTKAEALAEAAVAPVDTTSYHAAFDRGPPGTSQPDGVVDLFNDIVGVITQFGHDCR